MSWRTARNPFDVSVKDTFTWSPEPMNRSRFGSGVKVVMVESIGFGGAWVRPFRVTNAKLKVSIPTFAAQVEFWSVPLIGSSRRPKMFIAAHHLVGSQAPAPAATAKVGQATQPGG